MAGQFHAPRHPAVLKMSLFHLKRNILKKNLRKLHFCQRMCPGGIQNDDQIIDGVDENHPYNFTVFDLSWVDI